jgi:hypothetical protein
MSIAAVGVGGILLYMAYSASKSIVKPKTPSSFAEYKAQNPNTAYNPFQPGVVQIVEYVNSIPANSKTGMPAGGGYRNPRGDINWKAVANDLKPGTVLNGGKVSTMPVVPVVGYERKVI